MCSDSKKSGELKKHHVEEVDVGFEFKSSSLLKDEENIHSSSVLSLTVRDPRETPDIKTSDIPVVASAIPELNNESKDEPKKDITIPEPGSLEKPPSSSEPEGGSNSSTGRNLWDINCRLSPPVEESVICMEKHKKHMDFICLDDKKSGNLRASTEVHSSRSCPIILLKNNMQMGSFTG